MGSRLLLLVATALLCAGCRTTPRAAPRAVAPAATSIATPQGARGTTPPSPPQRLPQVQRPAEPRPAAAAPLAAPVPAPAQRVAVRDAVRPAWVFRAGVDLYSRYVWRGVLAVDDAVLQPSAMALYRGFSLNVWGNIDLGDANGRAGEVSEVDITLAYTHRIRDAAAPVDLTFGAVYYTSPSDWFDDFAEVFFAVSADVLLQPKLSIYIGVLEIEDSIYASLDCGHDVRLGCGTLQLAGGLGAGNHHLWEPLLQAPVNAFGEAYLQAGWALRARAWTFTPSVKFSTLLDGDLRSAHVKNDLFIFGLRGFVRF